MRIDPTRGHRARRGVAVAETGIVLSVVFLLFLGAFEFGRFLMIRNLLVNAAREGSRQAAVSTTSLATSDIQATVTGYLVGQQFSSLTIKVYPTDAGGNAITGSSWNNAALGAGIGVEVDASYQPLFPTFGILNNPMQMKVVAIACSEAS